MRTRTDTSDSRRPGRVPFKRHIAVAGFVMAAGELAAIAWPTIEMFELYDYAEVVVNAGVPIGIGVTVIWLAALAAWLRPVQRAAQAYRDGRDLDDADRQAAALAIERTHILATFLRTGLWVAAATALGFVLVNYAGMPRRHWPSLVAVVSIHALVLATIRGFWYRVLLLRIRGRLVSDKLSIRIFASGVRPRLLGQSAAIFAATAAATLAFIYYFLPISYAQYFAVAQSFALACFAGTIVWFGIALRLTRFAVRYADKAKPGGQLTSSEDASRVYGRAQSLPYRLGGISLLIWFAVAVVLAWVARVTYRFDYDDAVLILGITITMALGAAIYQSMWHRETLRTLLEFLTLHGRLDKTVVRPAPSLRAKLLLNCGGLILFACALSLFWGFVQYKKQVGESIDRQTELWLALLRSEVGREASSSLMRPDVATVRRVLGRVHDDNTRSNAVYYYHPVGDNVATVAFGGGPLGAPALPWYAVAEMRMGGDAELTVESLDLQGHHGRIVVLWRDEYLDLGALAVFQPTYGGRGPSIVRPLKELVAFFGVLFGICGGIVVFMVGQAVMPIRRLEQRAQEMAVGELVEPVNSGGEGDEIGRLTFALEDMRRALRDRIRTTEEVNLDLERAVQNRTADLAKKNRELAETLDKLTRTRDQLVRSEKMASIGQLVAGIAHEINNPVNAIVNTVGPLEEAIAEIDSDTPRAQEASEDVLQMLRVVESGAKRTKDIVQALHNYSRTDDESVVLIDLNRSLDDSLELLRHLLKTDIAVVRNYGTLPRVRGHAGQINQVFVNLIANAAHALAGQDDARIEITTSADGSHVEILLADNGPGIARDVQPRIFDPFFTTKDVGEGSGLGLSIVHGILDRHEATIQVDSEVGRGTRFTIRIPVERREP